MLHCEWRCRNIQSTLKSSRKSASSRCFTLSVLVYLLSTAVWAFFLPVCFVFDINETAFSPPTIFSINQKIRPAKANARRWLPSQWTIQIKSAFDLQSRNDHHGETVGFKEKIHASKPLDLIYKWFFIFYSRETQCAAVGSVASQLAGCGFDSEYGVRHVSTWFPSRFSSSLPQSLHSVHECECGRRQTGDFSPRHCNRRPWV